MGAALRDVLRLVRLDLKVALLSPWYYVVLLILVGLLYTWFQCEPAAGRTEIWVVDEVGTEASRDVADHFRRMGYDLVEGRDLEAATRAVAAERALYAVRIREDDAVEVLVHSPAHKVVTARFMRRIVQRERARAYDRALARAGLPEIGGRVRGHALSGISRPKGHWSLTAAVRVTFFLTEAFAFILWLLVRGGFERLRRKYSAGRILAAKLVAGTVLGTAIGIAGYGTTAALGVEYRSVAGLALVSAVAAAIATPLGFGLGLATRVLGTREDKALVLGLVLVVLGHFILDAASGAIQLGEVGVQFRPVTLLNPYFLLQSALERLSLYSGPGQGAVAAAHLAYLGLLASGASLAVYVMLRRA